MANIKDISVITIVISIFAVTYSDVCVDFSNPCLCVLSDETKIDLSSVINSKTNKYGYLSGPVENSNTTFYFSGCKNDPIIGYSIWKNYTVVVTDGNKTKIENRTVSIGKAKDAKFFKDPTNENRYELIYLFPNESVSANISLLCDNFPTPFIKVTDPQTNTLVLSSPEVCPKIIEHHGLSSGSVFLLLLLITAIMYFIGGGLVLYFIRGARGIEIIPNVDFWKNLPGLVKDGVIFLLSGCRPSFVSTAESYDRI